MISNFPNILGVHLDMSIDELKEVILKNNYGPLRLTSTLHSNYKYFHVSSKYNNHKDILGIIVQDDRLKLIFIDNWKEFFNFPNDINFTNVTEIFKNYYLNLYTCKVRKCNYSGGVEYYNDDWWMKIASETESITMCHRSYIDKNV